MMSLIEINAAGMSDAGRVRPVNQDYFLVNIPLCLFAVADGVESVKGSEVASRMAIELLEKQIRELNLSDDATPPFEGNPGIPLPARALKYVMRQINRQIYKYSRENQKYAGFGTTLTVVWVTQGKAFIGHIGDSRAYLIRKKMAQHLTSDHTTLSEKIPDRPQDLELYEDVGSISEHELSRAVGINPDVQVQVGSGIPAPNDRFVLCTDGLYGQLKDFEIADIVANNFPQMACAKLIQTANKRGGSDNIAVVVLEIAS